MAMGTIAIQNMRGGFFLMVSFLLLSLICAWAALATLLRPVRWCERSR